MFRVIVTVSKEKRVSKAKKKQKRGEKERIEKNGRKVEMSEKGMRAASCNWKEFQEPLSIVSAELRCQRGVLKW